MSVVYDNHTVVDGIKHARDPDFLKYKLFVGNLPGTVSLTHLCDLLKKYGEIKKAVILPDKMGALITFFDCKSIESVLIDKKKIKIDGAMLDIYVYGFGKIVESKFDDTEIYTRDNLNLSMHSTLSTTCSNEVFIDNAKITPSDAFSYTADYKIPVCIAAERHDDTKLAYSVSRYVKEKAPQILVGIGHNEFIAQRKMILQNKDNCNDDTYDDTYDNCEAEFQFELEFEED